MDDTSILDNPVEELEVQSFSEKEDDTLCQELKVYERILTKAIDSNSSEILPNSGEKHAAIMMSKLFSVTEKKVNMVVGRFSGHVSNQKKYLDALENLLNKNIDLNILLLDTPSSDSKAYAKLIDYRDNKNKNIEIRIASDNSKNYLKSAFSSKKVIHFAVFDNNKYRLEIVPETFSAFGCFNDTNRAHQLLTIFNTAFSRSIA